MNTLTCLPQSLCSWDYIVTDASQRASTISINFFTEQGSIVHDGTEYLIAKEGWLSGRWSLNSPSQGVAQAVKSGVLQRRFQILVPGREYELRPRNPFTRAFDIYATPTPIGWIATVHAFTRRATLECSSEMPVLIQLFSFWLVVITWRRAVRNNSGSASS